MQKHGKIFLNYYHCSALSGAMNKRKTKLTGNHGYFNFKMTFVRVHAFLFILLQVFDCQSYSSLVCNYWAMKGKKGHNSYTVKTPARLQKCAAYPESPLLAHATEKQCRSIRQKTMAPGPESGTVIHSPGSTSDRTSP